jgi:hypothetical protein
MNPVADPEQTEMNAEMKADGKKVVKTQIGKAVKGVQERSCDTIPSESAASLSGSGGQIPNPKLPQAESVPSWNIDLDNNGLERMSYFDNAEVWQDAPRNVR